MGIKRPTDSTTMTNLSLADPATAGVRHQASDSEHSSVLLEKDCSERTANQEKGNGGIVNHRDANKCEHFVEVQTNREVEPNGNVFLSHDNNVNSNTIATEVQGERHSNGFESVAQPGYSTINVSAMPYMQAVDSAATTEEENTHVELMSKEEQREVPSNSGRYRVGRWTLDEKVLFLYGLQKFGKGRWKKISTYVPQRTLVQIKSHAQKVMKRLEAGENVFHRLEENCARLHYLVSQIHERNGMEPVKTVLQPVGTPAVGHTQSVVPAQTLVYQQQPAKRRRRSPINSENSIKPKGNADGTEQILAASALCQLAAPEDGNHDEGTTENVDPTVDPLVEFAAATTELNNDARNYYIDSVQNPGQTHHLLDHPAQPHTQLTVNSGNGFDGQNQPTTTTWTV